MTNTVTITDLAQVLDGEPGTLAAFVSATREAPPSPHGGGCGTAQTSARCGSYITPTI